MEETECPQTWRQNVKAFNENGDQQERIFDDQSTISMVGGEAYSPMLTSRVIRWRCPEEGTFKCNTDGSSRPVLGTSAMAFCVRNHQGCLLYAEAKSISLCTALEAETKAFNSDILYCLEHNLMPLVMDTDSLIIKKVLDGIWEIHWSIAVEIRVIKRAMENGTTMIEHTYREGNKLADFLA
ncbi:hypothetical protein KY285_030269 [Solanum tuberosum]|nr:hypothetical protein KY285_030269 [Solanum tuberosum]